MKNIELTAIKTDSGVVFVVGIHPSEPHSMIDAMHQCFNGLVGGTKDRYIILPSVAVKAYGCEDKGRGGAALAKLLDALDEYETSKAAQASTAQQT